MNGAGVEGAEYVGFWTRLAATLVDLVGIMFVVVPVTVFLIGDGWAYAQGGAAFFVNWVVPGAAYVAFWVFKGATPGKMLFKAQVVDAQTGASPDFWQSLTRYIGFYVSLTPLLLGFIWVAFDRRKQAWHDKMARTVVIYRRR
jgi:uncharacterized RDD family membrane protein YckC